MTCNQINNAEFSIAEGIKETPLGDEIILFNGDTQRYLGLQGSAKVIWEIIKKYHKITVDQLKFYLADEWILSEESNIYIKDTLEQLFLNKMLFYVKS